MAGSFPMAAQSSAKLTNTTENVYATVVDVVGVNSATSAVTITAEAAYK